MVVLAAALCTLLSVPAQAGPHRARLSKDLADRVTAGSDEPSRIIIAGTRGKVQALAARYGARVHKYLRAGAVLEVTGGQLAAISRDPEVDHVSGDVRVQRMSVTAESTG
ncbi:MAG: hypothetical protein M3Q85_07865, partial [Acidobacteriota bacterium]|nr:hypothetical protein [Acidobacteriota bacterium]